MNSKKEILVGHLYVNEVLFIWMMMTVQSSDCMPVKIRNKIIISYLFANYFFNCQRHCSYEVL